MCNGLPVSSPPAQAVDRLVALNRTLPGVSREDLLEGAGFPQGRDSRDPGNQGNSRGGSRGGNGAGEGTRGGSREQGAGEGDVVVCNGLPVSSPPAQAVDRLVALNRTLPGVSREDLLDVQRFLNDSNPGNLWNTLPTYAMELR